jgi:hypothetical protein
MVKRSRALSSIEEQSCGPPPGENVRKSVTTIKCSLAGLKCSHELRYEIDDCVKRLHNIANKGSLVATQVLLTALEMENLFRILANKLGGTDDSQVVVL